MYCRNITRLWRCIPSIEQTLTHISKLYSPKEVMILAAVQKTELIYWDNPFEQLEEGCKGTVSRVCTLYYLHWRKEGNGNSLCACIRSIHPRFVLNSSRHQSLSFNSVMFFSMKGKWRNSFANTSQTSSLFVVLYFFTYHSYSYY